MFLRVRSAYAPSPCFSRRAGTAGAVAIAVAIGGCNWRLPRGSAIAQLRAAGGGVVSRRACCQPPQCRPTALPLNCPTALLLFSPHFLTGFVVRFLFSSGDSGVSSQNPFPNNQEIVELFDNLLLLYMCGGTAQVPK